MIAVKRATYEDLLALPEHQVGQIIDGELIVQPRPAMPHAWATSELGGVLIPAFRRGQGGPGGWVILAEPELHLGPDPDVLVPDLAGWRRERMPVMPETAYCTLAPDWICEVLSPSTAKVDRTKKPPVYARERVPHVWIVDPDAKTLEVFRLEGERYSLLSSFADEPRVRAEPFDAIELELPALFAR